MIELLTHRPQGILQLAHDTVLIENLPNQSLDPPDRFPSGRLDVKKIARVGKLYDGPPRHGSPGELKAHLDLKEFVYDVTDMAPYLSPGPVFRRI